jgi:dihydroxyacetone kinase-like protein
MKKFINSPADMPAQALAGFVAAHRDIVRLGPEGRYVARREKTGGKVALISGGGAGHEPMHVGYVGRGMLDAACPGAVFTSPTPDQMLAAALDVAGPQGAIFIVKNYQGDRMNFELAAEMAQGRLDGPLGVLVIEDDAGSALAHEGVERRGVAGTVIIERLMGAAAERGLPIEGLMTLGAAAASRTRTVGVALESCTVPEAGRPTFHVGPAEMEFGVGIHGEPGIRREALREADSIASEICGIILRDLAPKPGTGVLLMVNGFGATPLIELYLMFDAASRALASSRLTVVRSLVGNHATSLDMAGCSITLSVMDDEALALWDSPVRTAALRWGV